MLKSYITTLQADKLTVVCEPQQGHELAVISLSVSGGANGGYITISIGEFSMLHSIAANGRIVFPFFMGVQENMAIKALANNDGLQVRVSAEEFVADGDNPSPTPPIEPEEPELDPNEPLTFTTDSEEEITISLAQKDYSIDDGGNLYYRYKNLTEEWERAYIPQPNAPGLSWKLKKGDILQFMSPTQYIDKGIVTFEMLGGNVYASGNVQSLANYSDDCGNFINLFSGCFQLKTAPYLVTKNIGSGYCGQMYSGCVGLTETPILKFETLGFQSLHQTFSGCTNLTKAKITTNGANLYNKCFYSIFGGCSKLTEIEVDFTEWHENATEGWVSGVSATGTFYKPKALPEEYGVNRIPEGWNVVNVDEKPDTPDVPVVPDKPTLPTEEELATPLTIVAEEDGVEVRLLRAENSSGLDAISLKYKVNDSQTWDDYTTLGTIITLAKAGDFVQFKNESTKFNVPDERQISFDFSKKVSAKGNINSLINFSNNLEPGVFNCLFVFCNKLIDVKDLILPSLNLTKNCYYRMLCGTNITNAPKMLATSLADNSCHEMFYQSRNLNQVAVYFTEWLGEKTYLKDATYDWVGEASSSGVFYKPSALPIEYGESRIPEGWTVVNID